MKYKAIKNFYNGQFHVSASPERLDVTSPLDGSLLSSVPLSSKEELNQAVESAKGAFEDWSHTTIKDRVQVFFKYRTLLENYSDELTALVSEENGKTEGEARAEIDKSIELTEFAVSMPQLVSGEVLEVSRGVECRTDHFPLGV
ncbi:MAG: aldehyde dehydrogenase family protein, partial [Acidobacteriota bacterium]|nr:aldehyde dehydrogenase family protein [Acidobacteriota bacterium]